VAAKPHRSVPSPPAFQTSDIESVEKGRLASQQLVVTVVLVAVVISVSVMVAIVDTALRTRRTCQRPVETGPNQSCDGSSRHWNPVNRNWSIPETRRTATAGPVAIGCSPVQLQFFPVHTTGLLNTTLDPFFCARLLLVLCCLSVTWGW